MDGNQRVTTENINEVILRLLKLKSGMEMDYQTYAKKIKVKLASSRMVGKFIPAEEDELLRNEFKRVRNKEGRFVILKPKKTRVSSPPPPPGPPGGPGGPPGGPPKTSTIIKAPPKGKITTEKLFNIPRVEKVNVKDVTPNKRQDCCEILKTPLERINDTLDSIIQTLTDIDKENRKKSEKERIASENERRRSREKDLESKLFDGVKNAVKGILKPFQSIWDRIVNFITNIILGRILIKLINWIADPDNQGKIKSIIRFFKDWWPALLGSYVLFGTTFGKFIRGTVGMLGRFISYIGKVAIPQLLKFIRTPLGAGIALFTAGATIPTIFPQTVNEQERKTSKSSGTKDEKIKQLQTQKANLNLFEKLQGKGSEIDEQIYYLQTGKSKSYGFAGGGFSGGLGYLSSGLVNGPKGRDKVPAMLTDGEFVMSVGAVNKYGVETLEAMNAAGGGTNQPKVVGGKTYAEGGGPIGDRRSSDSAIKNIKKFIKEKIGYDVDKPETWGSSFSSAFKQRSSGSFISRTNSGFDFNTIKDQVNNLSNGMTNQAQGLINRATDPRSYRGIANQAQRIPRSLYNAFVKPIGQSFSSINTLPFEKSALKFEKGLNLKPGQGLSDEMEKKDKQMKDYIKNLYNPDKDTGLLGEVKRQFKDIMNKGAIPEYMHSPLTSLFKTETSDKIISNLTGGKINHLSAAITGLQYVQKGFAGPLGRPFQIDTQGLGRYQRSLMEEAQRMGHGAVGARALTQEKYDKMQRLSMGNTALARIANYALGQNIFTVDSRGRATTTDTWDSSTQDLKGYVKDTKAHLNEFGDFLQGKNPQGVGGLYKGAFKGLSGVLRVLQNTGWSNLHPGGVEVDLGGGFKPTDERGNVLSPQQLNQMNKQKQRELSNKKALESKRPWWDKMGWFGGASAQIESDKKSKGEFLKKNPGVKLYNKPQKNTQQPYKSRFSKPSTAIKSPVKPPPKPSSNKKTTQYRGGQRSSLTRPSQTGTKPPSFSPTHSSRATRMSRNTIGLNSKI